MKKITKLLAIISLLGSFIPVGAQEYKTREVSNAPAFTAIEIRGGDISVFFSQGEGYSFSINGPTKLVKATKIKIRDNTLFIDYNEPFFAGDEDDLTMYVSAPQLNKISVSGEADFKSNNSFQGQELTIKTRQNGEVSMKNVAVNQVKIDSKGSSSVDLDYLEANKISVSSLDRAEVELSGRTGQLEVIKKGMFAEIETEKLITTQTLRSNGTNSASKQVNKDGSVEFVFND